MRVTADNLNRLLALAGESVVASRWVDTFATELLRLKRLQHGVARSVNALRQSLNETELDERVQAQLTEVQQKAAECGSDLAARLESLDLFDRRFFNLSKRLYQEVLDCRMRPFADGIHGFTRMVRDAARTLGKEVKLQITGAAAAAKKRKRVLVVDDSLTVRELERKLIENKGYEVEVAVDGMDGWNAVRTGAYDLVVTDVDMPRLDGIELVKLIKKDARLGSLPVMIVSYKDREEDRSRGLEAGADYYLTKGSFHDETLLRAVGDLIGEAEA